MTELIKLLSANFTQILTGGIAFITAFIVAKVNNRGRVEMNLIDQLQEEILRMSNKFKEQDEKINELGRTISTLQKTLNFKEIYITKLLKHIERELPPPPPKYEE